MLHLHRTVRFCLNAPSPGEPTDSPRRCNNFAAWPPMRGLGRFYELTVACAGSADPQTGYFLNIKQIDQAFADHVLCYLQTQIADGRRAAGAPLGELMRQIISRLQPALGGAVESVQWRLTPYYNLTLRSCDMHRLTIREQFEFSAAHRLHVESLGDPRNREVFGKCNNPAGHGHNYRLEVAVSAPINSDGRVLDVEKLDELVDAVVIQKLDHKNLNVDVAEFAARNPSVENIAVVIYDWLAQAVDRLGVTIEEISVWETGKTVCTYRGETSTTTS